MRGFIVIVVLLAVGIGVTGFALGWFKFSTTPNDQKSDVTLTFDAEKLKKDRDAALAVFQTSRAKYQKQAETQLEGMDRSLAELKGKAVTAGAETKDQLNEAIKDLGNKTQSAREELKELAAASKDDYDSVKTRVGLSMDKLKDGFEKANSRFQ